MSQAYTFFYRRKEQIAENTWSFFFEKPKEFDYRPGQYLRMTLPHPGPDDRGTTRYFTIASSPLKEEIMITTKVIESTFKKTLFNLSSGQGVEFFGPLGKFILDTKDTTPKVFLAGGIGITPFHSMLTYAAEKNIMTPLFLFVSFSKTEDVVFENELRDAANKNPNIKVIYTITHPEKSNTKWTGETGRLDIGKIRKYVPNIKDAAFFSTGPIAFTAAMQSLLLNEGLSEEQMRKEEFSGY